MDTTLIIGLLAAIVALSIAAIAVTQLRERAKIERARKAKAFEDGYKRTSILLDELPSQYLTNELKLILLQRMEASCQNLEKLGTALPVADWLAEARQRQQKVKDDQDQRPPLRIDSPAKSTRIKELLENLFKLIESLNKAGELDNATTKKNLRYVLFLVHKTHADLHIFQARELLRQNEKRKAIHEYHLACTEMGKSKDNPLAAKVIKSLRTRIKELEGQLSEGQAKPVTEEQNRLDKEWGTFLEDDKWKKKADYDE
ncbi:hypothetical protein [Marinobacter sp. SS21]|uniref:hypothetical protein n=1 Tax=Marinobacter sp. SS21 TaxID=2979460 RepID=UPI00232D5A22|nr:hypothetical protein [Marinobacter sp. SS21]MDC0662039.1 hypothetical protein [Marinobacter sp. SS21]